LARRDRPFLVGTPFLVGVRAGALSFYDKAGFHTIAYRMVKFL
jgi:hypothetical protein